MKLRIQAGPLAGQTVDIPRNGLVIGRDPHCDLVLDQDGVSRHHARVLLEHGVYVLEDMGSTNGVRVNGQRITDSKPLMNGDKIGISTNVLLLTDEEHIANEEKLMQVVPPAAPAATSAADHGGDPGKNSSLDPATLAAVVIGLLILLGVAGTLVWWGDQDNAPPVAMEPVPSEVVPEAGEPPPMRPVRPGVEPALPPSGAADEAPRMLAHQILSEPPGAVVSMAGEVAGTTPLVLTNLSRGSHEIILTMPGYQPLSRFFYVPADEPPTVYQMRQQKGTLQLTSSPEGAAVFHGAQLLGVTPMVIETLPPGTHTLELTAPGHSPQRLEVTLADYRADAEHVELLRETGELHVTTFPAGGQILVDGFPMGLSQPKSPRSHESTEMVLDGLLAGSHQVAMELHGLMSEPRTITIERDEAVRVRLLIWVPNTTVRLTNNTELKGMLREQHANGDVELVVSPTRLLRIKAETIRELDVVPLAEAAATRASQDRR